MKSYRQELHFCTDKRRDFVNITPQVKDAIVISRCLKKEVCLVNAMHITASVFINDDERGLHSDFEQ